ncbi:hypothetical protein M408DRAFT_197180 [Serendipita vermifera MAFF 305830]|uniref:Uncharacterized protein n=1 Tax=Serendipita vermifera MAFF 305830 TaxID=933852 RepID=A0A0C3B3Y1_SERVB|nr:hypothetical protein M408DRAFT_197180 [Serendipita vermifera MAFF 305830]
MSITATGTRSGPLSKHAHDRTAPLVDQNALNRPVSAGFFAQDNSMLRACCRSMANNSRPLARRARYLSRCSCCM